MEFILKLPSLTSPPFCLIYFRCEFGTLFQINPRKEPKATNPNVFLQNKGCSGISRQAQLQVLRGRKKREIFFHCTFSAFEVSAIDFIIYTTSNIFGAPTFIFGFYIISSGHSALFLHDPSLQFPRKRIFLNIGSNQIQIV